VAQGQSVLGTVISVVIGSFLIGMLGWMMFYHSCMKILYARHDSCELQFPAYIDTLGTDGGYKLRDSIISRLTGSAEISYAFWGTPGVFTTKDGDDYIYIAFNKNKKHKSKEYWQKRIDGWCESRRNRGRPEIDHDN